MININDIDKDKLLIDIDKTQCERSLYHFFQEVLKNVVIFSGDDWEMNWHYEEILNILQSEAIRIKNKQPKNQDICLNLPFRSGKSTLLEIFTLWCWLIKPEMRVLFVASNQSLARKSSTVVKKIIEDEWFKARWGEEIILTKDIKAKGHFQNTKGGEFQAYGMSNATGRGGDILVFDDINQASDANSAAALRNATNNYKNSLYSRLNNFSIGLRIISQQRINPKDLVGYLKETNKSDYRFITIPAILTKDCSEEFIKFYKDKLFWNTRFSRVELQKFKNSMSPNAFASQLLQSSKVHEGTLIKRHWIKMIKQSQFKKIDYSKSLMFLDTNLGGTGVDDDPSGVIICKQIAGKLYIQNFIEIKGQLFDLLEELKELIAIYNIKQIYVEKASTGNNVVSEMRRQLSRIAINFVSHQGKGKEERFNSVQPFFQNEQVYMVEGEWNMKYMNYLSDFPHAKHDEAVDVTVYALTVLLQAGYVNYGEVNDETSNWGDDEDLYDDLY